MWEKIQSILKFVCAAYRTFLMDRVNDEFMPNIQFFSNLFDIMQERKKTSQLSWLWLSAFIIVLDYLSKWWMTLWLDKTRIVSVFPCLNFILTHNFGAAFSFLGQASGWQRWVFSAISGIVSIYLIRLLYRGGLNNGVACAVSLILGGLLVIYTIG